MDDHHLSNIKTLAKQKKNIGPGGRKSVFFLLARNRN
jgi:hypothetical protein